MHAIASMVERLRLDPGAPDSIGANGGFRSKYAVGIYSTKPRAFVASDDQALQQALDAGVSWDRRRVVGQTSIHFWIGRQRLLLI